MSKRSPLRPPPPKQRKPPLTRHTTISRRKPPRQPDRPRPAKRAPVPKRQVARIVEEEDASLLDLIDNLLNKGVMLNADLILALADVDLIYIRLSALLCAADRVLPSR